jgi:hypothetical protein
VGLVGWAALSTRRHMSVMASFTELFDFPGED